MKKALSILLLSFLTLYASSQSSLEVKITNLSSKAGSVRVALYHSENDFLKKPVATKSINIDGDTVICQFENLEPGEYAISSYHDENSNGKLDSNWVGMPTEPYGFSNNARGTFGPPSYSEAKIKVSESRNSIEFKLK